MADTDQELVDTLNAIRTELRGISRRVQGAVAKRCAEPDKRYADALKALAWDIRGSATAIVTETEKLGTEHSSPTF